MGENGFFIMTHVVLQKLNKVYPGTTQAAVQDMHLDIPSGQLVALLGPSGCGKTTTLKMIAGLIHPSSGDITFDGASVLPIPAERRGAVMVFQNYLLFPYMSVGQNVGFGLKMRGVPQKTINQKVIEMLELVKLPNIANRRPKQLSGGQQQRVALARALITAPKVLLLDEPLSNLDAHLRDEMRELILSIQRQLGVTMIFVTHDQEEAVLLANQIALIFEGVLQQYAPPDVFYRQPISERAARFFGGVNFIAGTRRGDRVTTALGDFVFNPAGKDSAPEGAVTLTIRPEQIVLQPADTRNSIAGRIRARIYVGTYTRYKIVLNDGSEIEATRPGDVGSLEEGDAVRLAFPEDRIWVVAQR
ncbi:MAG: ABC transporter ATP-binding protein [Chloroflexi bacterium]|nr:ABC transporter ATP-binding protein [Chloroflexota bacterium]